MATLQEHDALNELKAEIVRRGWKFKDLALRLGVTSRHLSDVLNGRARLTQRLGNQIHDVTSIPLSHIPLESTMRILICDPIAQDGVEIFRQAGADVDIKTGQKPEELKKSVNGYDALVVRSETKVTREILDASTHLQVVGRAGVGVDNIDVAAATEKGVVVVNAPTGNTTSAAEHAIALMMSLARRVPDANASLKSGKWERSKFVGMEVRNKTLGVVGLGQVGSEVARRARGLEMRVIAFDPFVPEERAKMIGAELVTMDELLAQSDFITVHTTLTEGTKHLIGADEIAKTKPTVRFINTARGGIIDEAALVEALKSGRVAGAAIDVFEKEPITDHPLFALDNVIVTPHLGASTAEAQERVAVDVAHQVIAVLSGEPARWAVNAPLIDPETYAALAPYVPVAQKAGSLAAQLHTGQLATVEIDYAGDIAHADVTPLKAAVIRGLLSQISVEQVNVVNVDLIAERRGLQLKMVHSPEHEIYSNLITVRLKSKRGKTEVAATIAHDGPHIVSIDEVWVDVPPSEGYLLLVENRDRPGMIGAVGTLMGEFGVNISFMNVGRHEKSGNALMVIALDSALTPEQIDAVRQIPDVIGVRLARL
ncbi:MAG TPA: phosphoglycerate dehydrogenase [Dehalococcoidia bacterium]|jgi:D-3-phosphoglycerate dehydrogenase|nr:phosphoglycerate dehydrogenase [Dehalococcoidia bacterium]